MAKAKQVNVKANINIKHNGVSHISGAKFVMEAKAAKKLEEKGYLEIISEVLVEEKQSKPPKQNDDETGAGAEKDNTDGDPGEE